MSDTGNFDKSDSPDKSIRQSVRPRTLTEKGVSYEKEKTFKASRDIARRIYKLCEKIGTLTSSDDYEVLNEAVVNLNEAHDEYERVVSKANVMGFPVPQDESQAISLAVTTAKLEAMQVNVPSDTSKTIRHHQKLDEEKSQKKTNSDSKASKTVNDPFGEATTEQHKAIEPSKDILPEKLVESMDARLQKQLSLVNQAMESNNNIVVELEVNNLDCLMKVISEEKLQLSLALEDKENTFLDSWFDQARLDVRDKKINASKYLLCCFNAGSQASHSECAEPAKTKQSSSSIVTAIVRDTNLNGTESYENCLNGDLHDIKDSALTKKGELSHTPEKVMVNKWLANQSDNKSNKSNKSSHSSKESQACRKVGSKSDNVSEKGSENYKLVENAKNLMMRLHKRLLMQLSLIDSSLATEDVELVRTETANLDRIFSEFSEASGSYDEFILDDEKSAHSRWLDEIDSNVFKKKQEVCLWLVNHSECTSSRKSSRSSNKSSNKSNRSSKSSNKSKASKSSCSSSSSGAKSAIQQKAITAGLQAEADILKETMSKAVEIEAKRKEEEIKSRIDKIQVQLARSKAMEDVYGSSMYPDQNRSISETQVQCKTDQNANESHSRKPTSSGSSPANTTYDANKQVAELSKDMVRALKAPSATIDVFTGDPLEYHYFRSNFTEAVEKNY